MKEERELLINSFLKSEELQKDTAEAIRFAHQEVNEIENELEKWFRQELELDKEISRATVLKDSSVCTAHFICLFSLDAAQ